MEDGLDPIDLELVFYKSSCGRRSTRLFQDVPVLSIATLLVSYFCLYLVSQLRLLLPLLWVHCGCEPTE